MLFSYKETRSLSRPINTFTKKQISSSITFQKFVVLQVVKEAVQAYSVQTIHTR